MVKILEFNNSNKKYNFEDISKATCKSICQTIKIGKDKIKNPLTNNTINYNSDITKQILQVCYKKYKIKEVKDIVDIEKLFESLNITESNKPKKLNKKGGGIEHKRLREDSSPSTTTNVKRLKSNNYNDIYDAFKKVYDNYTIDELKILLIELDLINNEDSMNIFINFINSCYEIKDKSIISINTLILHFENILKIFALNNSDNIIVSYDDNFVIDINYLIHNNIIQHNILPGNNLNSKLLGIMLNYEDILKILKKDFDIYPHRKVILFNSIFNRIYILKKKADNTFIFHRDNIISNNTDIKNLILKYNKTIPKYFSYLQTDTNNNKLNYLIAFLNCFSQGFKNNINIEEQITTHEVNITKNFYTDIHDIEEARTLTAIINNNFIAVKRNKNTNILTNNFKGTLFLSVLNKYDFLYTNYNIQVFDTRPIHVRQQLKIIEGKYKNNGEAPYSTDLNIELYNLITNPRFILTPVIKDRLLEVFKYLSFTKKTEPIPTLYVFHGTGQELSSNIVSAFLSTSLNINIAIKYALVASERNPYVYIFRIKQNMDFINFSDNLYQILLLPGTKINRILPDEYLIRNGITYIMCDIEMPIPTYCQELFEKIKNNVEKTLILKFNNNSLNHFNIISYDIEEYERKKTIRADKIYITHDNSYIFINLLYECNNISNIFYNLKYTLHQLIINKIYESFQPDSIIKYNIINFNNSDILIGWKHHVNLHRAVNNMNYKYDFNLLIVDLLCGANLFDSKLFIMDSTNKLIRAWFKVSGLFDGTATQRIFIEDLNNITEVDSNIEQEFIAKLTYKRLYHNINITPNIKTEIASIISDNINKLKKFKEENKLDIILEDINNLIVNILEIPTSSGEYKELEELLDTIKTFFTLKINYMLKDNSINITELLENEIDKIAIQTGGKPFSKISMRNSKKSTLKSTTKSNIFKQSSKSIKSSISSKSNISFRNLYQNTNTTKYDKDGYEIAPFGYSSVKTISFEVFNSIYKKYYKQKHSKSRKSLYKS
jgi:hypothetical protein